jgi:hypothetical protein
MNAKLHYYATFSALIFLCFLIFKQGGLPRQSAKRNCKLVRGKMDCFYINFDNRIYKNNEVRYNVN